jgi:hypothetical protein
MQSPKRREPMNYPGRTIKIGETDLNVVKALKQRLNEALSLENDPSARLDPNEPNFGPKMKQTIKFFQARHVDAAGRSLRQDGEVGSLNWAALFGEDSITSTETAGNPFLTKVVAVAAGEEAKNVREIPKNSNRGPQVEEYLHRAGAEAGNPWCCSFVYWCFDEAAASTGCTNPMVKTAGCLDHWQRAKTAGATRIPASQTVQNPALIKPGMVFIMDHGGGLGHTGLVESVAGGILTTIEGNTDASKTREGGGVYRLTRKVGEINKGFIDYSNI